MGWKEREFGWRLFLAWLAMLFAVGAPAVAQVSLGDNTELSLGGNLSFGYSGVLQNQGPDSNQYEFGGDATLTGFYYHPQFLSFRVNPFYNQSRLNSNFQNLFSAKGINASTSLFSGSHTPVTVSYEKSYNNQGEFGIPGISGVETRGRAQLFSVNAGEYFEGLPSLTVGYSRSDNSYEVLGSSSTGSGSGSGFTVGTGYKLAGFNLGASYSIGENTQNLPSAADITQQLEEHTHQNTTQVNVSRPLGWDSTNWSANFSRTHFTTDYTGTNTDQTYYTLASYVTTRPLKNLGVDLNMNYSTNSSAYLLGDVILPPGSGQGAPGAGTGTPVNQFSSDYLAFGARALYAITKDLTADGGVNHRTQNFLGTDISGNNANGGLGYGHRFAGGQFAAHYSLSWYSVSTSDQGAIGHAGSVTYSHDLLGWHTSGDFQYGRNVQTALVQITSSGYSYGVNTSRRFHNQWNVVLGAHLGKNTVEGLNNSDSLVRSFSASLAMNKLSFSGSYSRSSGNALQFGTGLVPAPLPGQVLLPGQLVTYAGKGYGFGGSYHPTRNFQITGSYARSRYNTANLSSNSDNLVERFDIRSEYNFRQLHFVAGYAHLTQGIGVTFNNPATVNSFYVGVSRHFDFF
jgi:hypothetical protein